MSDGSEFHRSDAATGHSVKLKFHGSSFLVASSPTRLTSSRGCYEETASVEFKLDRRRPTSTWTREHDTDVVVMGFQPPD